MNELTDGRVARAMPASAQAYKSRKHRKAGRRASHALVAPVLEATGSPHNLRDQRARAQQGARACYVNSHHTHAQTQRGSVGVRHSALSRSPGGWQRMESAQAS